MRFVVAGVVVALCIGLATCGQQSSGSGGGSSIKNPIVVPAGGDSCQWANDRECDEPDIGTGACALNTDFSDCRAIRQGEDDSCQWANDGECDEAHFGTGACVQGTDRTDCAGASWMRNQTDSCDTSYNGVCEEPGRGNASCAARTDRTDCNSRARPMTINDHFFGSDDRVRVNAREAPWRFMGRFTNEIGENCTATLIGRDVIITAAHCVHTEGRVVAGGEFVAEAGGATARTVAYYVDPNFDYQRFNTTNEINGLDWALLRIDQPLGDTLGFASVGALNSNIASARAAELYQAGYAWDTGRRISAAVGCHVVALYSNNTFSHECDTTRGDSGSSLLIRNGATFEVVGVDSSFQRRKNGPPANIAVSSHAFAQHLARFAAGEIGSQLSAQTQKPK